MKVYVSGYIQRLPDDPLLNQQKPRENLDVSFCAERDRRLTLTKQQAQLDFPMLISGRVHVEEHYCKFEVEEDEGSFTLVCNDHPALPHGSAPRG